jgi:hypothetical protein
MRSVLGQPVTPRFFVTKLSLDHPEGTLLDLRAHRGDESVDILVDGVELVALRFAQRVPVIGIAGHRSHADDEALLVGCCHQHFRSELLAHPRLAFVSTKPAVGQHPAPEIGV